MWLQQQILRTTIAASTDQVRLKIVDTNRPDEGDGDITNFCWW